MNSDLILPLPGLEAGSVEGMCQEQSGENSKLVANGAKNRLADNAVTLQYDSSTTLRCSAGGGNPRISPLCQAHMDFTTSRLSVKCATPWTRLRDEDSQKGYS
jgi:hypothetical protein